MARKRRTAEESRSIILDVAAARLQRLGLEGLNITGVAEEAGLSHATLIHHFGSSGGMRDALAEKMSLDLIDDLVAALAAKVPLEQITRNVFQAFTEGGHAKLVAWRAIEGEGELNLEILANPFAKLLQGAGDRVGVNTSEMQKVVMLVAVAAIGFGLAGQNMAQMLDPHGAALGADDDFPAWLVERIIKL